MKKALLAALGIALSLAASAPAFPQAPGAAAAPPSSMAIDEGSLPIGEPAASASPDEGGIAYFLRMLLVLAVVAAAMYGVFYLLKRASRKGAPTSDSALKVLASAQLGPGRRLDVVAVGGQAFLVGSTDSSMSLVAELSDKEAVDAMRLEASTRPSAPKRDFQEVLRGLLLPLKNQAKSKGRTHREGRATLDIGDPDFLSEQRKRLKRGGEDR